MRRRSLLILLLALPAAGEGDEERVAREVADAHARGDRGRLLLLAAEPALRVSYARVVEGLLRAGRAEAAEALARERQGPEAEGLRLLVRSFKEGLFPAAKDRETLREAATLLQENPDAALRILDAVRPREGTLFAADLSWVLGQALLALDRRGDARAEFERCALRARAVGAWGMARDADEARLRLATTGPEALGAAEAFLDAAKRLDDRAATIRALRARARVRSVEGEMLRRQGKFDDARLRWRDAREDYLAAGDLAEKEGDRRTLGLCWLDVAVIWHVQEGQPGEALKIYDRAIQFLRDAGAQEEVDGAVLNSALVLTQMARYDEALARLEELLAPGRTAGVRTKALEQKAYLLARTGRIRSALPAFEEAIAAAPGTEDRVRLLVGIGELHVLRADPGAALGAFGRALELAPDEPAAWAGRARAYGLLGDEAAARAAFEGALEREEDGVGRARLHLLAAQTRPFGDLDETRRHAAEALKTFTRIELREYPNAGAAWKTLADLTLLEGDHEKGAEQLAKAATLFHRLQLPHQAIELYAQETLLALMLGRMRDATERVQVLGNMAGTTPNDALKSVAKSAEALFEAKGGRGARALELLDEAQRLARAAGDRAREATALVNRASLEPVAAADHVRRALALLDEDRLWEPHPRPLVHGQAPDWGPGIALDKILEAEQERPQDALHLVERALCRRLQLAFRGRDPLLAAGLTAELHAAYVAARATLVEARATGKDVAGAEEAFDAAVKRIGAAAPMVADLAWPPEPPLAAVQGVLRADEALVMALFDPYVKCALVVDKDKAVLRRVGDPGTLLADVADLLQGKRTLLLACGGPAEAFPGSARFRICHVPTAAALLRLRAARPARGEGIAALAPAPERFGDPVAEPPARRLAMVAIGADKTPLGILRAGPDAETVVVPGAEDAFAPQAVALLMRGARNVVVAGQAPDPLDIFLDACLDRKLPVAAAFHEASAKGPLFLHGPPE